jgi:Leucine-rich repeat (LRR) protein
LSRFQLKWFKKVPRLPYLRKLEARGNLLESIPSAFVSPSIETLDLSENRLTSLPTDCLVGLTNLRVLDLHQNRLTSVSGLPAGSKLETLLLSSNRITKLSGLSADTVPELKILDLKDNKVAEFEDQFFTLTKIHTLDLTNNEFNRLSPELGLFVALKKFFVAGNPLKTIRNEIKQGSTEKLKQYLADMIDVSKLNPQGNTAKSNLVKKELMGPEEKSDFERVVRSNFANNAVNLSNQKLTVVTKEILAFENLAGINLSKNQLAEFPTVLADLKNLRSLILADNLIERVSVADFRRFDSLETLEFQNNKIVSFCDDFDTYEKTPYLRNLRSLDLSRNRLTNLSTFLANLPRLDTLSLGFNGLTNIEPLVYQGNDSLDTLVLTNNKIETISENIGNLVKLSALLIENNNVKNFPAELAFLNLKSLSIVGNPSMLATEKMSSKGTAYILSYLKNKLSPEKEAKQVAYVKNFRPRTVPPLEAPPGAPVNPRASRNLDEAAFDGLLAPPEGSIRPPSPNKETTVTAPDNKPTPAKLSAGKLPPPHDRLDVFGQPMREKETPAKTEKLPTTHSAPQSSQPPAPTSRSIAEDKPQTEPKGEKQLTAEQLEVQAKINALQHQLDTDFNLNNVKKLTIRKELNSLRAKLNQAN